MYHKEVVPYSLPFKYGQNELCKNIDKDDNDAIQETFGSTLFHIVNIEQ